MKTKPFTLVCCGGLEISGWAGLLNPILHKIEKYNEDKKEDDPGRIEVLQVKEKYGGLRIYLSAPQEFHDMVEKAEADSYHICMYCGSPSHVGQVTSGWITTLCKDCAAQQGRTDWKENTDSRRGAESHPE